MNKEEEEAGLPGLKLSSDQLFFVNFAQVGATCAFVLTLYVHTDVISVHS